jgi:hypothetical protein
MMTPMTPMTTPMMTTVVATENRWAPRFKAIGGRESFCYRADGFNSDR